MSQSLRSGLGRAFQLCPIVLGLLIAGCKKAEAPRAALPKVETMTVIVSNVPIYAEWVGTLAGFVDAEIRAQVSGYLISQDYREGDQVAKGAKLFTIDERPFQASLGQAQAELERAQAQSGKTEMDVKRLGPLAETKAISQQEYDDAVQNNLGARAQVAAAKASAEQARLNLGFTQVLSPVNGIAGIAQAQIGDLVGPTSGVLATVSTVDPIKAYFTVSEQDYLAYTRRYDFKSVAEREAHEASLRFELILADGSVYPDPGRFHAADRNVDVRTGALRLAALFPNPAEILRPGQFARVRAVTRVATNAVLVPQRALSELQGMYLACVVGPDNKAEMRPVKVGSRTGSLWIVEDGLKPGDRIVVEGIQKVRAGMPVDPQPWNPVSSSETPASSAVKPANPRQSAGTSASSEPRAETGTATR